MNNIYIYIYIYIYSLIHIRSVVPTSTPPHYHVHSHILISKRQNILTNISVFWTFQSADELCRTCAEGLPSYSHEAAFSEVQYK